MTSISSLMQSKQPLATGAWALYDYDEKIAKKFRLKDKFDKPYLLYKTQGGKLYLPRAVCPIGKKDTRVTGYDIDFDLVTEPRSEEQDRVIVETYKFLQEGQSGIVQSPTGSGKTYMALAVTALMRVPTLVVTTKEDLFDHWIEEAHRHLNLPYRRIGIIRQNQCSIANKPFSVAMIHSLAIDGKYPDWIRRHFALVHFDEVHRLPADEFMKVAGLFAAKWRVGWSATTYRADGKEIVFKAHIGPVRVVSEALPMVPEVYRYKSKYKLPFVVRTVKGVRKVVPLPHTFGRTMHVAVNMTKDAERNRLLSKLSSMCYKSGRKTVFFSDIIEHLHEMHGLIMGNGVKASDIGFYVGGMTKEEKEVVKKKRFILATYGFMKEGTDIADLDACIMATPKADVVQIIGRVLRIVEGKKVPIIIDVIDDDSYVFASYADKRLKLYESMGAKVVDVS